VKRAFVAVLCAACLLGTLLQASATALEPGPLLEDAPRIPGEVVVRFDTRLSSAARAAARASVDSERVSRLGPPGLELIELDGISVPDAIEELEARPDVIYAEPNYVVNAAAVPNDPYFANQWALHDQVGDIDIDAPEAWETTTGSPASVIAVVDTGVAWDHPDLADNVWTNPGEDGAKATNGVDDDGNGFIDDVRGWDWVDGDNDPMDVSGHGTHVAGIIGAKGDNSLGVSGIGWNTRILPLRVLNADGSGGSADIARGFWYAADVGARVVNASLGSPSYSQAVSDAVSGNPDVLFVAAAGNQGTNNDQSAMWPCNLPHNNVICVTAVGRDNSRPSFANVGPASVDIAAPGSSILSTFPNIRLLSVERFESDVSSRWVTGGTGAWGPIEGNSGLGYGDSPSGDYGLNENSWVATRTAIDTSASNACAVDYDLMLDTVRPDAFYVETSRDGGSWRRIAAYTGSTEGSWERMSEDIGSSGDRLDLRFRLVSDARTTDDGAAIDDVVVTCAMKTYSATDYSYLSGTSMAAPHVAGVAGLLFSAAPDASTASVRSAILDGVDAVPALGGLVGTAGRVNAARALSLLLGAPSPTVSPPPDVVPTPTASVDPIPDPSTSPEPIPTITPEPENVEHGRIVNLRMIWGPRLRGRVVAADDYAGCSQNVVLEIRRNGVLLKTITTDDAGRFWVRVPSTRGSYRAIASPSVPSEGHVCLGARSPSI
jgi:subtilisin family serine protease